MTAQTPDIHAHIPLPVPDILSARRQCSFPIAIRFSYLLYINRQPHPSRIIFVLNHHIPESKFVNLQRCPTEAIFEQSLTADGPHPV